MKPGDRVRVREVLPVEWPDGCTTRQRAGAWELDDAVVVGADGAGRFVVMLTALAGCWSDYPDLFDGEPRVPCLVLPAAALEPVPPALPEGWRVYHGDGWTELWFGSQGEVARVIGDRLVASLPAHLPYPDSAAAIAHLLAVAVPTIATGGEVYAVASEVARG